MSKMQNMQKKLQNTMSDQKTFAVCTKICKICNKYAKYVSQNLICRICTPHFADDAAVLQTESVALLVSNIHDIILVHTQYRDILVCTCLYYYTFPVPVCTRSVPVRTDSEPVRTKYPVPVMRVTIPDARSESPIIIS